MEKSIKTWLAEHEEEFVKDLGRLIAIDSVQGETKPGAPFGEGPKKALGRHCPFAKAMASP